MPREREFEETEVVARAAHLFAVHGYGGTSVSMLLKATGLAKQSLYNAFGDKRGLYLRAIDCSVTEFGEAVGSLADQPTGRAALQHLLSVVVERCLSTDPAVRSCIVTAGLLESLDDPLAVSRLKEKFTINHEIFRGQIERGQRDGSVRSTAPSAELADVLMGVLSGLRVSAKLEVGRDRLTAMAARGLEALHD